MHSQAYTIYDPHSRLAPMVFNFLNLVNNVSSNEALTVLCPA
uniref:Uncharacterized protein n=1 Tax=Arundo donax TaxID=35708 RepID=A0A0A9ALK4_ARUDO